MENVHKYFVVDTSLLFDRAKVEQFSARCFVFNLLSRHRNVEIADYDLVSLLIEWRRKHFDCLEQRQLVSDFGCDLDERIEEMRRCLWDLMEVMPIDCVADLSTFRLSKSERFDLITQLT